MKIVPFDSQRHKKQVIALWIAVFGYESSHNKPELVIDKKLEVSDDLFFVALSNEKVVGTAMAGYDGHRGWIYSLAVSKDEQRKGIGTKLVQHAESALAAIGCMKVNLQIAEGNEEVEKFYLSIGFKTEKRISMGKTIEENIVSNQSAHTTPASAPR